MNDNFMSFLGITKKAGKCIEGYNKCEEFIRKGACHLVLVSTEASQNTKDKFTSLCDTKNIPLIIFYTSEDLSKTLGRKEINVVGVSDKSMTRKLMDLWNDKNNN